MFKPLIALAVPAFVLSACGDGAPGKSGGKSASSFNATDACATLPKDKVAAATGLKVESSTLSSVTPATATSPGFSACTYSFAEGGTLGFYARQSPSDDTPETIAQTRSALTNGMGAKITDLSGIGSTVFSAQPMGQLHVFFGGDKYMYFMTDRAPIKTPILDVERALAGAVIG